MIEDDRWCPDIPQQIAAITAAPDTVAIELTEGHVQHRMAAGAEDRARRQQMTRELMQAPGRLAR